METFRMFSYSDLERSNVAATRGIENKIPFELLENADTVISFLDYLCAYLKAYGMPYAALRITSGYRCAALNKLVGGAASSDHLSALAVDITHPRLDEIYDILRKEDMFKRHIRYMEINSKRRYIHISLKPFKLPF